MRMINKIIYFYIIISFFMFAFINFNESTDFANYVVPYIEGKVIIIHFCFSLIIFLVFVLLQNNKIKVDNITILLFLKILFDVISFFINYGSILEYISYLSISVVTFMIYFMLINIKIDEKGISYITNAIVLFGICICLQVIYTYFNIPVNYFDINYKSYMNIPIGGTNVIASFLNPILALIILKKKKKVIQVSLVLFFLISIILTKSRGGMLLALVIIFYLFFFYKKKNNKYISFAFGTLCIIGFLYIFFTNEDILNIFSGYANGDININNLSTGRMNLWRETLIGFKSQYWLFGESMRVSVGDYFKGSHNILIDSIVRCGIIGGSIYSLSIFNAIKICSKKKFVNEYFFLFIIILINAMFEVCYFYYIPDFMFWLYVALAVQKRKNHYENNCVLSTSVSYFQRK